MPDLNDWRQLEKNNLEFAEFAFTYTGDFKGG